MGKLVLFLPDGSTRQIALLKERIVIGRRADNDVCLPYPAVSAEHAAVVTILADSFLEDLGSTNGTLVNGATVTKHFLRDRDQIDIGRQKFLYLEDEATDLAGSGNLRAMRNDLRTFGEQVEKVPPRRKDDTPMPAVIRTPRAPTPRIGETRPLAPNDPLAEAEAFLRRSVEEPEPEASNPEPEERVRTSTDRALEQMARIRNGNGNGNGHGNGHANGNGHKNGNGNGNGHKNGNGNGHAGKEGDGNAQAQAGATGSGERDGKPPRHEGPKAPEQAAEVKSSASTMVEPPLPTGGQQIDTMTDAPAAAPLPDAGDARHPSARITVLSGASAGRTVLMERSELVIGRVGVQVAAIDRTERGYWLSLREGDTAPLLNGERVESGGVPLKSGDIFEVAGARMEFLAAPLSRAL